MVTNVDLTASDQLLSLGQFLRARQADILADWKSVIRDTSPNADRTARGSVTPLLLDQLISAVERHRAIEDFPAAGVIDGQQTRATPRHIASDLSLLGRAIMRRLNAERSSISAAEYRGVVGRVGECSCRRVRAAHGTRTTGE